MSWFLDCDSLILSIAYNYENGRGRLRDRKEEKKKLRQTVLCMCVCIICVYVYVTYIRTNIIREHQFSSNLALVQVQFSFSYRRSDSLKRYISSSWRSNFIIRFTLLSRVTSFVLKRYLFSDQVEEWKSQYDRQRDNVYAVIITEWIYTKLASHWVPRQTKDVIRGTRHFIYMRKTRKEKKGRKKSNFYSVFFFFILLTTNRFRRMPKVGIGYTDPATHFRVY